MKPGQKVAITNPKSVEWLNTTTEKANVSFIDLVEKALSLYIRLDAEGLSDDVESALSLYSQLNADGLMNEVEEIATEKKITVNELVVEAVRGKLKMYEGHKNTTRERSTSKIAKDKLRTYFDFLVKHNEYKSDDDRIAITPNVLRTFSGCKYDVVKTWVEANKEAIEQANGIKTENAKNAKVDGINLIDWLHSKKSEVLGVGDE